MFADYLSDSVTHWGPLLVQFQPVTALIKNTYKVMWPQKHDIPEYYCFLPLISTIFIEKNCIFVVAGANFTHEADQKENTLLDMNKTKFMF